MKVMLLLTIWYVMYICYFTAVKGNVSEWYQQKII